MVPVRDRDSRMSDHGTQPQIPLERVEIPVAVQQFVSVLYATCSNQGIDGFAYRHTEPAQRTEVPGSLDRDLLATHIDHQERSQHPSGITKILLIVEALQDFGQNQIANCQGLMAEQAVEKLGLRGYGSSEVIDPDARIDKNQPSFRTA